MTSVLRRFAARLIALTLVLTSAFPVLPAFANTGTLNVVVSPQTGQYQVRNDVTGAIVIPTTSGSQTFAGLQAGDYIVDFLALSGYQTPSDQTFTMNPGATVTITGIYTLNGGNVNSGTLIVDVSPNTGSYEVRNDATNAIVIAQTTGDQTFGGIPFGDYRVDFLALSGYQTPASVSFTLDTNTPSFTATGTYTQNTQTGTLTVDVSPNTGSYNVRNDVTNALIAGPLSGDQTLSGLTFGDYRVDFLPLTGYQTPASVTFTLDSANPSFTAIGTYSTVPQTGTVMVNILDQNGAAIIGSWTLHSGTSGLDTAYTSGTGSSTLLNVPTGPYFLTATLVNPYTSVVITSANPQTVNSGQTVIFEATYFGVTNTPDPTITGKSVSNLTPTPGETVTYTVNFANTGVATATSMTIVDDYDQTRLTGIVLSDPANCANTLGVIRCTYTNVAPGQAGSFSYTATVNAAVGQTIANTATITGGNGNSNLTNDSDSVTITVVSPPDLTLTKGVSQPTAYAGQTVTYTLTYGNDGLNGTGDATNVVLTDDYDQAAVTISNISDPVNCSDDGDIITCNLGILPYGTNGTITYDATLGGTLADGTVINNTATITATETDASAADNTDAATITVRNIDLTVAKSALPSAAPVGTTVTYTLTYGNDGLNGTADATGVTLVDDYDQVNLTNIVLGDPVNCSDDGDIITCNLGNLTYGTTGQTFTYTADIALTATDGTFINNSVAISGNEADGNAADNSANFSVVVANLPDLAVTKTANPLSGPAGSTVTYTLTYGNTGTLDATGVVLTDDYDQTALTNIVLTDPVNCSDDGDMITCNAGNLTAGTTGQTFAYTADIQGGLPTGTVINNTVTIDGNESDANAINDTDTATVTVANPIDLTLTKAANPVVTDAGSTITYTLTYGNDGTFGDNDATNVVLTDDYDQTLLTNIVLGDPVNCSDDGDIITCNVASLTYGTTGQVFTYTADVIVTAANGTVINNTATISASETDGNAADNTDAATVTIGNVDLSLTKVANPTAALPGATITYTLTYGNAGALGSQDATGVTIVDDYDQTLLTNIVLGDPVNCSDDGDVITCNVASLTYGTTGQVFTYTADIAAGLPNGTNILNGATISANETDGDTADNSDNATVVVSSDPDLSIVKTANPVAASAGNTISYTLTYGNTGAVDATSVVITDDYDQTTLTNIVLADPVNCSDDGDIITCNAGTVAQGATGLTFAYTADIQGTVANGTVINNTATIDGAEADANAANDTSTATVTVGNIDLTLSKVALPSAAPAGSTITYTLTYGNAGAAGSADATGVTITDDYDQTTLTNIVLGDPVNCSDNGDVITCNVGNLTYGTTGQTFAYTADIQGAVANGTVISNTATISGNETDGNAANNTATANVTVATTIVDMDVVVSANPTSGATGTTITYTFTYGNNGPNGTDDATGVTITNDYDQTLLTNIVLGDPVNCSDDGDIITCNVASLTYGTTGQVFTYTADAALGTPIGTVITNTATIAATEADGNVVDNTSSATFTVTAAANQIDLTVAKAASTAIATPGSTITYTLTYGNDGAGATVDATNVVLTDDYDQTLLTNIVLADPVNCSDDGDVITCNAGTVTQGTGGLTFSYTADVVGTATNGAVITNTATITGTETEANAADNTATANVTVSTSVIDLTVAKAASTISGVVGSTITYTLTYGNDGAGATVDATNVVLTDDYDQTLLTNIVLGDPVNCSDDGDIITCNAGTVTQGTGGLTFSYTADIINTATPNSSILNTVTITGTETEVNAADNTATATVTVAGDFTINKTASSTTVNHNDVVTYTIVITRNTTGAPVTISVTDTITGTGTIAGNNGGAMNVITGNGTCVVVGGGGCGVNDQIDTAAVDVTLTSNTSQATITYEARATESGIPAGSTAVADNTATGSYAGQTQPLNATESVTINGPAVTGGGGSGGGSGATGIGGGYKPITGTMTVNINKEVSLDGATYRDASTQESAIEVPEHTETKLYYKVTVTNDGPVSATDLLFKHQYSENGSGVSLVSVGDVRGATYNARSGTFKVDKVKANEAYTFFYTITVSDRLASPTYAEESIELTEYGTALPVGQDRLTKIGVGTSSLVYLYAGPALAPVLDPEVNRASSLSGTLFIQVTANATNVSAGQQVVYTIFLENTGFTDITGLETAFDYDEAHGFVVQADGSRDDGRTAYFRHAVLHPAETLTYSLLFEVGNATPTDTTIRNITRALTSEIENISPVESRLYVVAGGEAQLPDELQDRPFELAQTGPALGFLLLSLLLLAGAITLRRKPELKTQAA